MNLRGNKRSTRSKQPQEEQEQEPEEEIIYNEGEILAIYDESQPDNFFLAKAAENIKEMDQEAQVYASTRGAKPNEAYTTEEVTISMDNVITFVSSARLVDLKSHFTVTNDEGKSFDSEEQIKLRINSYRKLIALTKNFRPAGEDEAAEEEEEEEEEEEMTENIPKKKARKIVGAKKSSTAAKNQKSKRTKTASGSVGKGKSIKTQTKKRASKPKKRYKKGKWNLDIEVQERMEQWENESEVPNLDRSVMNNNRELIRAANIGSVKLMKKVIYSNQKISTLNPKWGCYDSHSGGRFNYYDYRKKKIYNELTPLAIAMKNGDEKTLEVLLRAMDPDDKNHKKIELTVIPPAQISKIDSGFNDKYAYGVATRAVNMSRGNKEGNNAFLRDMRANTSNIDANDIQWMMGCNEVGLKEIKLVVSFFPNLNSSFLQHIKSAVAVGNREKAAYFIAENLKRDTYTFNKFHKLALTGKSEKSFKDIQKRNVTKKAQGVGGYSPIHCACINPNVSVLKHLLELKPEFNLGDDQGKKPVHYASVSESPENLEFLISNNVDTRDMDLQKKTPLMYACEAGRPENVKLLLGPNRSNVDAKDKQGYSAIHYAAQFGNLECIQALIEGGADINRGGPDRRTALHLAAETGNFEICEYLIEKEVRRTSKDKFKRTALVVAVMNGQLKIASLLLKHGAPFDIPDSSDNHPLHYACAYGYPEMIDLLMEANCDPNLQNAWKLNATTVALLKNYFECVRKMLDYPQTDVNCTDNNDRSLLSLTVKSITTQSFENFCFLLKDKGADPNHSDTYGLSTLHHLCRITPQRVFETNNSGIALLKSQKDRRMKQARKLYKQFLNEVLNNGADINLKNKDGLSPIFLALKNKNVVATQILLEQPEIDLNVLTNNNETVFHYLTDLVDLPEFMDILQDIVSKITKVKDLLNRTADSGLSAVHHIIDKFVKSHNTMNTTLVANLTAEAQEKKREAVDKMITKKSKKAQATDFTYELTDADFNGLMGGARTKSTARKSMFGMKRPRKKFTAKKWKSSHNYQNTNNFGESNYTLTLKETQKIKDIAEQKVVEATHNFLDVLNTLKSAGADFKLLTKEPVKKKTDASNQAGNFSTSGLGRNRRLVNKGFNFGSFNPYANQRRNKKTKKAKKVPSWVNSNCLHLVAASSKTFEFFKFMIEKGKVKINEARQDGKTPLLLYISNNPGQTDLKVLEYLLKKKANINQCDDHGKSAIFYSCENFNLNYIERLLLMKPKLDVRSKVGDTPLIILTKTRRMKLVDTLLDGGADINFCDIDGRNVLHWAVNQNNTSSDVTNELENLLLSRGANPNKKDKRNRTPLHYAFVKIGNPFTNAKIDPIETVSNILSRKEAKANFKDDWGYTPLHYAAQRGSVISALYLLKNGAKINAQNEHGNTPLNLCLLNNHKEMAIFLIQKDADLTIPVKVVTLQMLQEEDAKRRAQEKEEESQEGMMVEGEDEVQSDSSESEEGSDTENEEEEEDEDEGPIKPAQYGFGRGIGTKFPRKTVYRKAYTRSKGLYGSQPPNDGVLADDLDFKSMAEEVTTFMITIRRNWQGIAFLMLEYGFDLSIAILDCFNAKRFNYVYTLLLKKSDSGLYQMTNEEGQNIAHLFSKYSGQMSNEDLFTKIYNTIKSKKIDFSLVDDHGKNCLHYSSESGRIDLSKDLIDLGLDINSRDENEDTPFSLLLKNSFHKLEEYLTAASDSDLEIDQLFPYKKLEHRATTFVTETKPKSRLIKNLDILRKSGADINLGDSRGYNPLILMVRQNYENEAMQFYADFEPVLSVTDNEGKNVIHHIVSPLEFGFYQNVNLLDFFGDKADLNLEDEDGNPPIYYASLQSNGVMKDALVNNGADEIEIQEDDLMRVKSSLLNDIDFPDVVYDMEEDFEAFKEECKEKERANEGMVDENENKEKPHSLVSGGDYEVLYDEEDPYSVFLVKVEIGRGYYSGNTFYRMQLLREKVRGVIVLFTNWGRNGTNGQYQHTPFGTVEEGENEFKKIFKQKSKNAWEDRHNFVKYERKYRLVTYNPPHKAQSYLKKINYKDPKLPESDLEKPIYKFIRRICNAKIILRNVNNFQFDTESLPVRNLTRDRLIKAEAILTELIKITSRAQKRRTKGLKYDYECANLITDLTNEFYELIPCENYKETSVPPLSQSYTIQNHLKMITDLLYREIVIKLLCGAQFRINEINPIDYCMSCLSFKTMRVRHNQEEYKMIKKYISASNQTGSDTKKLISNIYAVERKDEREGIQQWETHGNKMLLWHGTKAENVIGILQTGFRIAPSGVAQTGSMFGSGIYFADLFSKSYNYTQSYGYCPWQYQNQGKKIPKKYMLLCEVALGNSNELKTSKVVKNIPNSKHQSVKGVGNAGPDFAKSIYLANGCMVPVGNLITYPTFKSKNHYYGGLQHNEYVVYDTTQVRIKYVVELRQK